MRKPRPPRERAARALCELEGHPPDIKFEGKPMWESYLHQVDAVLKAVGWQNGVLPEEHGPKAPKI